MEQTITFKVIGEQQIHCAGCESNIQRALNRIQGVREVKADHQTQRAVVQPEPTRTNADTVKARLETMGYHAAPVA